jgi:hypothetical protein
VASPPLLLFSSYGWSFAILSDLDLEKARRMLRAFIETKPEEWSADMGR